MTAATGAIVTEEGSITMEFLPSGITYASGDIIILVLASGTSISTTSPTCTEGIGEFTVTSCTYTSATRTLVMTMGGTVTASPILINVAITNFVYPETSLSSWPSSGGATITVTTSGGTSKGIATNVKLTGVSAGTLTATITHDSSKPTVGDTDATIKFSVTVPHSTPTTATMTIYFPLQPVSNNHVVVSPT